MGDWKHLKTQSDTALHPFDVCGTCGRSLNMAEAHLKDFWLHPNEKNRYVVTTCMSCASDTLAEQRRIPAMNGRA
jgi:hypothetical protein